MFKLFVYLFNWLLLLSSMSSLTVLDINPYQMYDLPVFSPIP